MTSRRFKSRRGREAVAGPRVEAEILAELSALCGQPGFARAVARSSLRDDILPHDGEITSDTLSPLYSRSRLLRTEVATLLGYMVQAGGVPFEEGVADDRVLLARAEALLEELHRRLGSGFVVRALNRATGEQPSLRDAESFREPIFYGGEAAYSFQYLDFALRRHRVDDEWMRANKGFVIEQAVVVARTIQQRLAVEVERLHLEASNRGSVDFDPLDAYGFTLDELIARSGLEAGVVEAVLRAFSTGPDADNLGFNALSDFNLVNAQPIVRHDDRYYSFKHFALNEAIYESPFFWMIRDPGYQEDAKRNRGTFTEDFAYERLVATFGPKRVARNVDIYRGRDRIGEIDVLVEYGGRAIVVQCKSKKLTLPARSGNDKALKTDFGAAFQAAYDQAVLCAESLSDAGVHFVLQSGERMELRHPVSEVLPLCLISEHYPALSFQIGQFLKRREVEGVLPALFTDVFTLDAMAEMLDRPLYFLNYLELRARFGERIKAGHELTLLSYHLKHNLWVDDKIGFVMIHDDFSADLEIAMAARRVGLPGAKVPRGILTQALGTPFDRLMRTIEAGDDPVQVDLGILLLQLGGEAVADLNEGIEHICAATRADGRMHDFSIKLPYGGVTVHSSIEPDEEALSRLRTHVALRKYDTRSSAWHGACLNSFTGALRFAGAVQHPWTEDPTLARAVMGLASSPRVGAPRRASLAARTGRNDPCPCGSGRKFKRCCVDLK